MIDWEKKKTPQDQLVIEIIVSLWVTFGNQNPGTANWKNQFFFLIGEQQVKRLKKTPELTSAATEILNDKMHFSFLHAHILLTYANK